MITSTEKRTDPFGTVFPTRKLMCQYYSVTEKTFRKRLDNDWTLRQALNIDAPPQSVICPLGKEFKNLPAMCQYYKVTPEAYKKRIESGWTERQALNIDPKKELEYLEQRTDPFGRVFETQKLMCEHYNTYPSQLRHRLGVGWTFRQALNIDPRPTPSPERRFEVECPNGLTFKSKEKMCEHYGIKYTSYAWGIKKGWTERQALGIDPPPRKQVTNRH